MEVAGVSPGGVLIPSTAMPQTVDSVICTGAEGGGTVFDVEHGGGFLRPYQAATELEDELESKYDKGVGEREIFPPTGLPSLPEIMEDIPQIPPLSYVSWCKTDALQEVLGMRPDCDFVIPLVAEIAQIVAIAYLGDQGSDPGERPVAWLEPASPGAMEIVIGWSPTKPIIGEREHAPILDIAYEKEPSGAVYVRGNPFGGGPTYTLPISWRSSPYPLDCLQVGFGNYNPTAKSTYDSGADFLAGSAMMPFNPAIRKYEKEYGRAARKAFEEKLIGEGLIQRSRNQKQLVEFEFEKAALWEGYEAAYWNNVLAHSGEIELEKKEHEEEREKYEKEWLEVAEEGDALSDEPIEYEPGKYEPSLREKFQKAHEGSQKMLLEKAEAARKGVEVIDEAQNEASEQENKAYDKYATFKFKEEPLPNTEEFGDFYRVGYNKREEEWREKYGPYRLGVKKWAYRFKWNRPPGGLPNLSEVGGYFVIELRGRPGTRWVGAEGAGHMGFEIQQGPPILGGGRFAAGQPQSGAVPS